MMLVLEKKSYFSVYLLKNINRAKFLAKQKATTENCYNGPMWKNDDDDA